MSVELATPRKRSNIEGFQESSYLLAVIGAVLIWSASFVATKVAYASFPPLTLAALRFILATLILAIILAAKKQLARPPLGDLGLLALSGLLGITGYFALENLGVKLTTASDAALIVASFPALTMLLEIIIYRSKVSWIKALGILIAISGVYLIVQGHQTAALPQQFLGNALLVGAGIIWAFYNFVTRTVVKKHPLLVVSFYQTVAGTIGLIPLGLTESRQWQTPTPISLVMLLFLGIFCSAMAYLLYNYGLRKLSSISAVTLLNLVPVFGVLFAVLFLHEVISLNQAIGGAIVIIGVMLSIR